MFIFVAIAILAVAAMGGDYKFQIAGTDAKPIPLHRATFTSASCSPAAETNLNVLDLSDGVRTTSFWSDKSITSIKCDVNVRECEAIITITQPLRSLLYGICPINAVVTNEADLKTRCTIPIGGDFGSVLSVPKTISNIIWNVNNNYYSDKERLVIIESSGALPRGNTVTIRGAVYNLKTDYSNNFKATAKGTCHLADMGKTYSISRDEYNKRISEGTFDSRDLVAFDSDFNFITDLTPITDSIYIVQYGGKWVYITRVGEARNIIKTTDNKYVIDYNDAPINAPDIICLPYQILASGDKQCNDKGTAWISQQKQCTWYGGGLPQGRIRVGNQECLAKCDTTKGEIAYYDCVNIIDCPMGQTFDASQKKCIDLGGGVPVIPNKACNTVADCTLHQDEFWWSASCEKPTALGGLITTGSGQCAYKDNSGYWLIAGGVIVGLMFVSTAAIVSGKRKR